MVGGWQTSGILYLRSGLPFTVTQTQGVQSTRHRQPSEPHRHRAASRTRRSSGGSTVGDFVAPTDLTAPTATPAATSCADPGSSTSTSRSIKLEAIGRINTEFRVEAFNLLNHPQFANPANTIGIGNVGTISSLLPSTPMRQLQFMLKARF